MVKIIVILLYTIFIVMFIPYIYGEPDPIDSKTNNDDYTKNDFNNNTNLKHKTVPATLPVISLTSAPSTTASTIQHTNSSISLPLLESKGNLNKPTVMTSVSVQITDNEGNRMNKSVPVQTATEYQYLVTLSDKLVSALISTSKDNVQISEDSSPYKVTLVQGYDEFGKKIDRIATLKSISIPKPVIPQPLVTIPRDSQPKESIVDVFGIKKIYPTKAGGEEWYMNMKDINDDPRFEMRGGVEKMVKNFDGTWSPLPNDKVRLAAYTFDSKGKFNEDNPPTFNQKQLASIGHWYKENDWLNVEMSGYFKLNSADDMGSGYSLFSRSAGHGDADGGCGGATPKFNFGFDGQLKAKKEMWHVSYLDAKGMTDLDLSKSFKGKWLGIKGIIYNLPNGDVRQEFWVDKNNNGKFEKLYVFTDSGGFGEKGSAGPEKCGGQWDQKYTWGSPKAVFRWDQADVSFKYLSVREIIPPINIRLSAS